MKISIHDIYTSIREVLEGSEIQYTNSVYDKDKESEKLKLVIFLNKLYSKNNVILYTKLLFFVDNDKKYLRTNKHGQNYFKYLYDLNCKYRMIIIDNIEDFKIQLNNIISNNKFGKHIKLLSEFIKRPSFLINEWFSKNDIKDISVTGFKYEPKVKVVPCESISFGFTMKINNENDISLNIRKDEDDNLILHFHQYDVTEKVEDHNLKTLINVIGEALKKNYKNEQ